MLYQRIFEIRLSIYDLVALLLAVACAVTVDSNAVYGQDLRLQEQQAIQKAVAVADPSIVRIETVGGVDLVGDLLTGTGPTTGVVVRSDGYIITSRFNFISNPASVVVTLADERQFAAEIVANDLSRMLTLLKIKADDLVPLVAIPKEEFRVGQWALALGRTFDMKFPNISIGIVSALDRVWGRALQTDAKTSPVNYGGPLIDLTGRCLGVIVPLSPQKQGETAGVEWYDSGIGFAVPLVDIQAVLPRLIEKETLKSGLMGVGFVDHGPVSGEAKVIRIRPESPADHAGLLVDDVIVGINGQPVEKLNDLKHVLGAMYAGEVAHLTVHRGEETLKKDIELTDALKAYQFPYLGVLPARVPLKENQSGARVRTVIAESPASKAGLKTDDLVQRVGEEDVSNADELRQRIHRIEPGSDVQLTVQRGEETLTLQAKLENYPNEPPESLDQPSIPQARQAPDVKTGRLNEQLPDEGLTFWANVPENYRADQPWGLLLWLHPPGDTFEAEALKAWGTVCEERGLILVGPRAGDVSGWSPDQAEQVKEVVVWMQKRYNIDPTRIVVMGRKSSTVFASRMAFKYREIFRGLIMLSAPLRVPPPDNDPDFPLQFAFVSPQPSPTHKLSVATVEALQKRNFPTWLIEPEKIDEAAFPSDVVSSLAIWLDSLDRI